MAKENFQFLRIPRLLFSEEYKHLSVASKVLYSLLLERYFLSAQNGWIDENGNPYLYYPIRDLAEIMNVSKETVMRLMRELESAFLIQRKKQGLGKPDIIFVFYFESAADVIKRMQKKTASGERLLPKKLQFKTLEYARSDLQRWLNAD